MKIFRHLVSWNFLALALLALITLFRPQTALWAQESALTLAEYSQYLERSLAELEALRNEPDGVPVDLAGLTALQKALASIETVTYPSGEVVTLQPLITDEMLPQPDATNAQAVEHLETIIARIQIVHAQIIASEHDNSAERLALLKEIFSRPTFNPQPTLWERLQKWFGDLVERFWPQPTGDASPLGQWIAQAVAWTVAIIGGLLAIWLLSYWLRGLLGNFIADAEARRIRESGELIFTATETRAQAIQSAQIGNYRQAVRQLYLSALLGLEERGVIRYDRSQTNREVLAQSQQELQEHLQPIVDTFDNVWYGIHEPDENTFADYQREIDILEQISEEQRDKNVQNKV